jgi:predicted ArsR family transcriptional regulator
MQVDAARIVSDVMQEKRRQILDILKEDGSATIRKLSGELKVTGVTVRHHLNELRERGIVSEPRVIHSDSPGRPQFEYRLTPKANEYFPNGLISLSNHLLQEMKARTDSSKVRAILSGVARRSIADAPKRSAGSSFEEHVNLVVDYLTDKGYLASWERNPEGIILHTSNCPYEGAVEMNPEMCQMDHEMITSLLGTSLQFVCHLAKGDDSCSYLITTAETAAISE